MSDNKISPENVADYYNEFAKQQVKTGLNLRHYMSFSNIKKNGLKKHHDVLEVGCGIGTFTKLLLGYVKKGSIVSTDISEVNVKTAKKRLKSYKNAQFLVSDMSDFSTNKKFDFIVMIDVLEHIPVEQHPALFKLFRSVLKDNGTIFINIPHHNSLDYMRTNHSELLQIIDQSLTTDLLIDSIYKNDLRILNLNSISIFSKSPDYQTLVLKPNETVKDTEAFSQVKIIRKKTYHRIKSILSNI